MVALARRELAITAGASNQKPIDKPLPQKTSSDSDHAETMLVRMVSLLLANFKDYEYDEPPV